MKLQDALKQGMDTNSFEDIDFCGLEEMEVEIEFDRVYVGPVSSSPSIEERQSIIRQVADEFGLPYISLKSNSDDKFVILPDLKTKRNFWGLVEKRDRV